jgi:hypothetical protein
MANFWTQRKDRNRKRFQAMGRRSQAVQAQQRMADVTVDDLTDALSIPQQGDAIGSLQYRDFRTGKVRRWTVLRGDRADRVVLRSPDGRQTQAHGWTWVMDHLRGYLAGRKAA